MRTQLKNWCSLTFLMTLIILLFARNPRLSDSLYPTPAQKTVDRASFVMSFKEGLHETQERTSAECADALSQRDKVIVISLARQWMCVYQDGGRILNAPVTSGRPELRTPPGIYHIFLKVQNATFTSPWPRNSPYYFAPLFVNYALEWGQGGFFLHDSPWRSIYGPGTNVWHQDPVYGEETGTHGCVTLSLKSMAWLYHWASIGTLVRINP